MRINFRIISKFTEHEPVFGINIPLFERIRKTLKLLKVSNQALPLSGGNIYLIVNTMVSERVTY